MSLNKDDILLRLFIVINFQTKVYFRPKSAGISPHSSVFHLRIVVV